MAERPVALEGRNLGLCIALGVLWIGVLIVFVGPGRTRVAAAQAAVAAGEVRSQEWEEHFFAAGPLTEEQRATWRKGYAQLREFGAPGEDELELTTWVAATLRAPSLRRLEVTREAERDDREPIELRSPEGDARIVLEPVFVDVRFESDYADLSDLLSRIEDPRSALDLRHIEVKREQLTVRAHLSLDVWTRRGVES